MQNLPPLQTRSELNQKLYKIREGCNATLYATLILIGIFTQNIFLPILLFVPGWLAMAATYTQIDNHFERIYKDAIAERKRQLTNR